jgi:predicted phage tail protein
LGWLRKIVELARTTPDISNNIEELTLLKKLVKDIQQQIKVIDGQRKYLTKQQNKFRQKLDNENEDDHRKLTEYEEENKNLNEHLSILEKKLKLIETRLLGVASHTAGPPGSGAKEGGDLKS